MTAKRDAEFAEYVSARLPVLRRLALLLCQDWHHADDLVQGAITKLYVHWPKARAADNIDAYVRAIVVREFLHERRSGWARRVTLPATCPTAWTGATTPTRPWTCRVPWPGCPPGSGPPWCSGSTAT